MLRKALILAAGVLVLAACSDGGGRSGAQAPSGPAGGDAGEQPVTAGGGIAASCVEDFSVDTLGNRDWAFDGTVTEVRSAGGADDPYVVEFDVERWYKGGGSATATVKTYDVSGHGLSGEPAIEIGSRVLASGDDDYLWGCGFSMPYSSDSAELFDRAFS